MNEARKLTKEQKERLERIKRLQKELKPNPNYVFPNPDKFTMPVNPPSKKRSGSKKP
jgi:hypothetical protein